MTVDQAKYDLKVIVPRGVKILNGPRPESMGAKKLRDEPVGTVLKAIDILVIEGVPYGQLIPRDLQKPEYVRISEAGGLVKEQLTGKIIQFEGVLTYCQVTRLVGLDQGDPLVRAISTLADDLRELASTITLLIAELRARK